MTTRVKWLKKLQNNKHFISEVCKTLNIPMTEDLNDIWAALKLSLKDYPKKIDENTKLIGFREGERFLDSAVSRTILQNKAKDGVFRLIDEKLIQDELMEFKKIVKLKNLFLKYKAITPSKDIYGKNVLAIIPQSITNMGVGRLDQEVKATAMLLQDPFVVDFIKNLAKISPETINLIEVEKAKSLPIHEELMSKVKKSKK